MISLNIIYSAMIAFSNTATSTHVVHPPNPNDPESYLPLFHEVFEDFHQRYHHYPKYWEDTEVNCSDNRRLPGCGVLLMTRLRKVNPHTPEGPPSRYTYVIVSSGRNNYRIEVRDRDGKALFYSDQNHRIARIK